MAGKPRKSWGEYSPRYRRDLERHGITEKNYRSPEVAELRKAARRHTKTPERPERALRNPGKYPEYLKKLDDLTAQIRAHKHRLFDGRINPRTKLAQYDKRRSDNNARINPVTKSPPNRAYVKRFLAMTEADIIDIDWSDDDWGFLFYH